MDLNTTESLIIEKNGPKIRVFMHTLAMTLDIKGEKEPVSVISKILTILKHSVVDPDP
jgi:hypothetical protein